MGWEGRTLGMMGPKLLQRLLECLPLRSQPTGRRSKFSLFPLPTSRSSYDGLVTPLSDDGLSWLLAVCVSLNSIWGDELYYDGPVSDGQLECLNLLAKDVKRFCDITEPIPSLQWEELFKVKSIDYKGEEVKVARWFQWKNVQPALPNEVGRVPLADVCTLGSKFYVENFDRFLKERSDWSVAKAPKVMVSDSDWGEVCEGLVASGVCVFLEASEVFSTDEGPLLNGLFGVTKDDFTEDGTEVYRLIMNLIPLNGLCQPMSGDIGTLPSWSLMNPMQPIEQLLISRKM